MFVIQVSEYQSVIGHLLQLQRISACSKSNGANARFLPIYVQHVFFLVITMLTTTLNLTQFYTYINLALVYISSTHISI